MSMGMTNVINLEPQEKLTNYELWCFYIIQMNFILGFNSVSGFVYRTMRTVKLSKSAYEISKLKSK